MNRMLGNLVIIVLLLSLMMNGSVSIDPIGVARGTLLFFGRMASIVSDTAKDAPAETPIKKSR